MHTPVVPLKGFTAATRQGVCLHLVGSKLRPAGASAQGSLASSAHADSDTDASCALVCLLVRIDTSPAVCACHCMRTQGCWRRRKLCPCMPGGEHRRLTCHSCEELHAHATPAVLLGGVHSHHTRRLLPALTSLGFSSPFCSGCHCWASTGNASFKVSLAPLSPSEQRSVSSVDEHQGRSPLRTGCHCCASAGKTFVSVSVGPLSPAAQRALTVEKP